MTSVNTPTITVLLLEQNPKTVDSQMGGGRGGGGGGLKGKGRGGKEIRNREVKEVER